MRSVEPRATRSGVWRRVVCIAWKPDAPHGAVARAQNLHAAFQRQIPACLSVAEGWTFTSLADGGGAYPGVAAGRQNRGFDTAIEIILSCTTAREVQEQYFDHPAHVAAAAVIDPLVADAWAMDWVEDRNAVRVPSPSQSVMKHICFFQWEDGTTQAQQAALFNAWKTLTLPGVMPHCLAVSCGEAIRWKHGDNRGFRAGLVVDLALESGDGVPEIAEYATSEAYGNINATYLAPIRKDYIVMDFAVHAHRSMGAVAKL